MVQISTPGVTPNQGMGPPWGAFCQITLTSCLCKSGLASSAQTFFLQLLQICPYSHNRPNISYPLWHQTTKFSASASSLHSTYPNNLNHLSLPFLITKLINSNPAALSSAFFFLSCIVNPSHIHLIIRIFQFYPISPHAKPGLTSKQLLTQFVYVCLCLTF